MGKAVPRFDFQVVRADRRIIHTESQTLLGIAAVWERVAALAEGVADQGARIHVLDEQGEAIIRVGVVTARASTRRERIAA